MTATTGVGSQVSSVCSCLFIVSKVWSCLECSCWKKGGREEGGGEEVRKTCFLSKVYPLCTSRYRKKIMHNRCSTHPNAAIKLDSSNKSLHKMNVKALIKVTLWNCLKGIHEKKHIWWGQTSYIAIPRQCCFKLISSHQQGIRTACPAHHRFIYGGRTRTLVVQWFQN